MKVITVNWAFMTKTIEFPVLKSGKIISGTTFDKGEGQWTGRFPTAFLVCTDDAEIEEKRTSRSNAEDPNRIFRVFKTVNRKFDAVRVNDREFRISVFKYADQALSVAKKWCEK